MAQSGLSAQLLKRVLSIYFIVTISVTAVQITVEYINTKQLVRNELATLEASFESGLTRAVWEMDFSQVELLSKGLLSLPQISGIVLRNERGEMVLELGQFLQVDTEPEHYEWAQPPVLQERENGVFGYTFPLFFDFYQRQTLVGDITLYSNRANIFNRLKVNYMMLIGNALIKSVVLVVLFIWIFNRRLSRPLNILSQQLAKVDLSNPKQSHVDLNLDQRRPCELHELEFYYNDLLTRLDDYQLGLAEAHAAVTAANEQLDQHNEQLAKDVASKTAHLERTLKQLEQQKSDLRDEVDMRKASEQRLLQHQRELQQSLETLQSAQQQLVESDRLASLGALVAGITHEINTPIGVSVTAISYLEERLKQLEKRYKERQLTEKSLTEFIADGHQSTELIQHNMQRAAQLIASFKQVAVDQSSEQERTVHLASYIPEVIRALGAQYHYSQHQIDIHCPEELYLTCKAGALSQVLTNLVANSFIHGFEENTSGHISINVSEQEDAILLQYGDDGKGIDAKALAKLFEPFFTTRREQGGSGLGTHIVYSQVVQELHGTIKAESSLGKGLHYEIRLPKRSAHTADPASQS